MSFSEVSNSENLSYFKLMFQLFASCNVRTTKQACQIVFSGILNPRANLLWSFNLLLYSLLHSHGSRSNANKPSGFFGCTWTYFLGLFTVTVNRECIRFPKDRNIHEKDQYHWKFWISGIMKCRVYVMVNKLYLYRVISNTFCYI